MAAYAEENESVWCIHCFHSISAPLYINVGFKFVIM